MPCVDVLRNGHSSSRRTYLSLLVMIAGPLILFFVPQVHNIWYSEAPPLLDKPGWSVIWYLFAVFLAFSAVFYLVSVYLVPRPYLKRHAFKLPLPFAGPKIGIPALFESMYFFLDRAVTLPAKFVDTFPDRRRILGGFLPFALGIGILLLKLAYH